MAQRETRVFRVRATPEFSVYTAINEGLLTLPGTVLDEPSNVTPARLLSRIVGDPYDGTARRKHAPKPDAKRPNQDAAARALAMQATEFIHTLEDPADDADLGPASVELPSAARRTLSLLSLTVQDLLLAIRARLPAFVGDDKELSKRLSLAFDGSAIIALGMLLREVAREAVAGAVAEGRIAVSEPLVEPALMTPIEYLDEAGGERHSPDLQLEHAEQVGDAA